MEELRAIPDFTTTTTTADMNTFLVQLQQVAQAQASPVSIFHQVVAYPSPQRKTTCLSICPPEEEANYKDCATIGTALHVVKQSRTIWWICSSLNNITREGGSADASID